MQAKSSAVKKARSAAPGPYLGYSLQPVRLCYHLLTEEPGTYVSIEHEDDVAIHFSDGRVLLEQTKSALTHNPLSDWSVELWKTFGNWVDHIQADSGNLDATQFRLYVTPPHVGEIVAQLNAATTDAAADDVVKLIEEKLLALPAPPKCTRFIKKLLKLPTNQRRTLVKNFRLESSDASPIDAIKRVVRVTVSDGMVDFCCEYAIGKAKEKADALIRSGDVPQIEAGIFRSEFQSYVKKHDLSGLLASLTSEPTEADVTEALEGEPLFVQQLDLIDVKPERKMRAVSDFLRASSDKTMWAQAGKIVPSSIDELETDLIRAHGFIRDEVEDTQHAIDAKARGRTVYSRCCGAHMKLEGREVPGHFIPGCCNDLANKFRLGWHPDYKTLLPDTET